MTPPERQEKMRAVDERRVRALTGKAGRAVALSYFTSTDLESAGKLKLKISRIRLKNGIRTSNYRAQPIPGANRSAGVAATGVAFADLPI